MNKIRDIIATLLLLLLMGVWVVWYSDIITLTQTIIFSYAIVCVFVYCVGGYKLGAIKTFSDFIYIFCMSIALPIIILIAFISDLYRWVRYH